MPSEELREPLSPTQAKALARKILKEGLYAFSGHAEQEMEKEKPPLTQPDCVNVLRGGAYEPGEWENGSWRYRAHTARITVVITFRSKTELLVVTAWRNR